MTKILPLLVLMIVASNTALMLTQTVQLPYILFWFFLILSIVFNIWGIVGLVLHFRIRKVEDS